MNNGNQSSFQSNRSAEEMWSHDCFSSSFAVSLANYMRDRDIPANYITSDGRNMTSVSDLYLDKVYGKGYSGSEICFEFDSYPCTYQNYATGIPEMGLIVRNQYSEHIDVLDIKTTVVPDSSTHDSELDRMGPEITIRAPTLMHCCMSVFESLVSEREKALDILSPVCENIDDWSDAVAVSDFFDEMVLSLDRIESVFVDYQKPVMMQAIWRTQGLSPFLESNALDLFVWSDFALTRLFLDSARRGRNGSVTRPMRCTVRFIHTLYELLSGNKPDLGKLYSETSYGISNGKEMMINGKTANSYMRCSRLTKPAILSSEVPSIMPSGTEDMIVPERRLDQTMYYSIIGNKA